MFRRDGRRETGEGVSTEVQAPDRKKDCDQRIESPLSRTLRATPTEELVPFPLPQAEGDKNRLLKVDSEAFASEQRNCTGLKPCWEKEREGKGEFVKKGDLLFRKNKDHFGNVNLQLVIKADLRNEILALCHESTSAHLGVTKA
ncbi:hypothetical protein AVEN_146132-1 [Araneus ventricosus]|uniref:Uncharacterized protein n=1 Tax=Araneus ventricosus TaxID=182803 RepID=A0A4Y2KN47_ARAVE|nr:hypothetical protein AVEN_146132-1 [Araneus ventricosus]